MVELEESEIRFNTSWKIVLPSLLAPFAWSVTIQGVLYDMRILLETQGLGMEK